MELPIYEFLASGAAKNANVDGSVTPVIFKYTPTAGFDCYLHRMLVHIEDVGAFDADKYGNNIIVANGMNVGVYNQSDDSVVTAIDAGETIKTNSHWGKHCFDISHETFGIGNEALNVRWTFSKAGYPLHIRAQEYFGVVINDNLAGLVAHYFTVQGFMRPA